MVQARACATAGYFPQSLMEKKVNNLQIKLLAGSVLAVGVIDSAMATLPADATAAFGTITTNVTDVLAAVWPIVALATGGFLLIRLFKKGANKTV